jgi:hypothetical protein
MSFGSRFGTAPGWLLAILIGSLGGLALTIAPASAATPSFRKLAASIAAFQSDGSRYVAWQTRIGGPVMVFDTRTGAQRRLNLPPGCELSSEEDHESGRDAAAGRFLLSCRGTPGLESALLNGRSGTVTPLPNGARWIAVGTRYALGVSAASTCVQSRHELAVGEEHGLACLALYDLAGGRVSYRPPSLWPDLDQTGAPAICPSLRARVFAEELRGGVGQEFDYSTSRFARPAKHRRYIELDRCSGRPTILGAGGNEPENFDLRGGLLSWDTGHPSRELELEGEGANTGSLTAYNLATHRLRRWPLPHLPVRETNRRFSVTSVLGYSTHTANMVFWIATTAGAVEPAGGVEVQSSAVYAAAIR